MADISFRHWLQELYYQNCTELESYHLNSYTLKEYYSRYKWWLRREYRHQMKLHNDQH